MRAPASVLNVGRVRKLTLASASVALACGTGIGAAASDGYGAHAAEVIAWEGPFGPVPYDDPLAVLGPPSTEFLDPFRVGMVRRVSLVEPAFHVGTDGAGKLLTSIEDGGSLVVRFERPVRDDPANAYGIDFLVFGNAFYGARGGVGEGANLAGVRLSGEAFFEPLQVSVSPGYLGGPGEDPDDWMSWSWYRYGDGPYGDTAFPTQAFRWDREAVAWSETVMDFTKPVNPALAWLFLAGHETLPTVADAIDLYDGSGGGTGFDLAESGFAEIRYVRIEALPGHGGGEIDAFAAARPMVLGDSLTVAPASLEDGPAILRFRRSDDTAPVALTLRFTEVDGILRVATRPLKDVPSAGSLPGQVLASVGIEVERLPLSEAPQYRAGMEMSPGSSYAGAGDDLELLRWDGTGWQRETFHYNPDTRMAVMSGDVMAGRYVLVQGAPSPALSVSIGRDDEGAFLRIGRVAGRGHAIERTSDWMEWREAARAEPGDGATTIWRDPEPPEGAAFYRVRLDPP